MISQLREESKDNLIIYILFIAMFKRIIYHMQFSASKCCQLPEIAKKMRLSIATVIFVAAISIAMGQNNQNRYVAKPGSCPPALPVQFCGRSCYVDAHCAGSGKCCPTQCGGAICSMPVTAKQSIQASE